MPSTNVSINACERNVVSRRITRVTYIWERVSRIRGCRKIYIGLSAGNKSTDRVSNFDWTDQVGSRGERTQTQGRGSGGSSSITNWQGRKSTYTLDVACRRSSNVSPRPDFGMKYGIKNLKAKIYDAKRWNKCKCLIDFPPSLFLSICSYLLANSQQRGRECKHFLISPRDKVDYEHGNMFGKHLRNANVP